MVVNSVVERLELRPELDVEAVKRFLAMAIQAMSAKIQIYFNQHPDLNKIEDMGPIIDEVKVYMDMVEHGIVA
ncbi:hypothetical protein [Lentilactobacillus parafarraginis]|uniref:Uncharacterized protein n=3 Tax=Lentilactobacillus parafarraginis TaxID=390842 RepID=A0A0R1YR54_9LACO|nr:hypothetical protein [Lentilactobacillus parafarraginis]KRM41740.1 hypothetical protein FD47_GL002261 [Lentilactobacillus parafarraginis DSM 18390 = JCM 14109]